ncbi:hypothetical protein MNBD_GAMMA15-1207 [hydrothermal vent metagenome]|uniref:Flagellar hook-length control protein FliK n=1 Tax=hydrothermal vent metagenome TaxID=652676 RepID=A0A3B0Z0Y4_9ZZZZ
MMFNDRHARVLVLFSTLFLMGASVLQCSVDSKDSSSGGASGVSIDVRSEQKISANSGNFNGNPGDGDQFGSAIADLGDLEADGVRDLAVGTPFNDDGGTDRGAFWVLFMDNNGRVDIQQKVSSSTGGLGSNTLGDDDLFGSAIVGIGDLDGDGVFDLVSGTPGGDDGGTDRGELRVALLDTGGNVLQTQKVADGGGGFNGTLDDGDLFGSAVADIGDVDGDGIRDLAVGVPNDDEGASNAGAVWILFMGVDGRVINQQKIANNTGGFGSGLSAENQFGASVAGIGDLDNDGVPDLVVGAPGGDEGGADRGEVWIVFLDATGRVSQRQRIADSAGNFGGALLDDDRFGSAVADIGDVNGDGIRDLAVGAPNDDEGADNAGAVWVITMTADGRVDGWQKVADNTGGFNGNLSADDQFGAAVAGIGDLDGDGVPDLVVGAPGDDDGGLDRGAVWVLFLDNGG